MALSPLQSVRDGPMIAQSTGHDDAVAVAGPPSVGSAPHYHTRLLSDGHLWYKQCESGHRMRMVYALLSEGRGGDRMQCPHCQHENRETARFCAACGHAFAVSCAVCSNQNPPGAAFCDNCGTRLARPTPEPPPVRPQAREPLAYTPRHLAEKILTSRSALEGERKQVTVLFCDLANSTAMAAHLGPDNMHALLNRFFDLALDNVHRQEGTINQFLGDGFMALFGAPIAHEDHARAPCWPRWRCNRRCTTSTRRWGNRMA